MQALAKKNTLEHTNISLFLGDSDTFRIWGNIHSLLIPKDLFQGKNHEIPSTQKDLISAKWTKFKSERNRLKQNLFKAELSTMEAEARFILQSYIHLLHRGKENSRRQRSLLSVVRYYSIPLQSFKMHFLRGSLVLF